MKSKELIFRADGNSEIGLGHLYRVFSLVEMLKEEYCFVFLTKGSSMLEIIPEKYTIKIIPEDLSILEEADWIINNYSSNENIIIADGYQFISGYQEKIKQSGFQLVYIDDLIVEHMSADIVINHSPGITSEDYLNEDYTQFALGTEFALLRPCFLELAKKNREIKEINSAFVCFGGADPFNLTIKAVEGLLESRGIETIHIVLGAAYKDEQISVLEKKYKSIKIYKNLSELELIRVMLQCNIAIAPSSTILYEICCVKMPVLSGYYVDNQKKIYKELLKKSIIYGGDDFTNYKANDFKDKIEDIISSKLTLKYIGNQKKHFDGKSKVRFLGMINQLNISFRKAKEEDLLDVYNWSNDLLVRKNSFNSDLIKLEDHKKWYLNKIKNKKSLFLIILINGKKGGVVRFEVKKDETTIGVLIAKNYRGQKLASKLLKESSKLYFNKFDKEIYAYIKKENKVSIKSFEKAGYKYFKERKINGSLSSIYKLEK